MPRFELQTKLPPSCCGGVRGPHTVEGSTEDAAGVAGATVDAGGGAIEVDGGGVDAGWVAGVVVAVEEHAGNRTTSNISIRHRILNLPMNNFFILRSLLISYSGAYQNYVYYLVQFLF